ncbi:MAG: SDR family NAD(P)-dependent oxidoreductase, partial [Inhella sp.]
MPTAVARRNTPLTPAELANLDSRANSPRESAEERMANAMGAKGWTVVEGVQGGTMTRGPHGECLLSRPSMLNEIPGHPHAGMVPNKVSGCGGLHKGARVALSARNHAALKALAENNERALVLPLDVSQHAEVLNARDELLAHWAGIDLVLVVAGAYNEMRVDSFDMSVVNQLLDVNLRGVFHCFTGTIEQARPL